MSIYKSETGKIEIQKYYSKLLESLVVEYKEINIETSYGNTFIIESGVDGGIPIILLHGSGINSSMWVSDINELSKKYKVYAVDILGECGRSSEKYLSYKNQDYADWLDEVRSKLGIETVNIIGASLGSWIGLKYSIHYPLQVNKLILLAPAGIGKQNPKFLMYALFYMLINKRRSLFNKINGVEIPSEMLDYQILINKYFISRKEVLPVFSDEELGKLQCDTSIYVGKNDIILKSSETVNRSCAIKNVAVEEFENLGHSLVNMTSKILRDLER